MTDDRCTFCGHPPHAAACPREVQVAGGRSPVTRPCPCVRHLSGPELAARAAALDPRWNPDREDPR